MSQSNMPDKSAKSALIFGASGAIGGEIAKLFLKNGMNVYGVSRSGAVSTTKELHPISWSLGQKFSKVDFAQLTQLDAVVWAQGANFNDNIDNFDRARHLEIYEANVVSILESLSQLLGLGLISSGTRLCVISSIWQEIARQCSRRWAMAAPMPRAPPVTMAFRFLRSMLFMGFELPSSVEICRCLMMMNLRCGFRYFTGAIIGLP